MNSDGLLNIYEQYYEAELKYGFFIKAKSWQSIGQVMFIAGIDEGQPLRGEPPYFNNPKVIVRLFYADSVSQITESTKSRVVALVDGGTYRYQPVV